VVVVEEVAPVSRVRVRGVVRIVVVAVGFTFCFERVAVVVLAVVPVEVVPAACVLEVVFVVCDAVVLWLVVALGLIVTLLRGIALKFASVFTVVLALGLTVWLDVVDVLVLLVCASAAPLIAANTAAATNVNCVRIMRISS
jgi:hypothetical protein